MDIKILEMIDGAQKAKGLTVIIDVFRAFSLEAYLFDRGAERILAVGKEETAWLLKMKHPDDILIGERGGKILPGFDYGNSPAQTKNVDLKGKTVIHTTSAGTQGLVNAVNASEILTGSLVNSRAIAEYIRKKNPSIVSLVAMGLSGKTTSQEDVICAKYIKSLLEHQPFDTEAEIARLKENSLSQKFFDPALQDIFPEEDFWMCTKCDIIDIVLSVKQLEKDIFLVEKTKNEH